MDDILFKNMNLLYKKKTLLESGGLILEKVESTPPNPS